MDDRRRGGRQHYDACPKHVQQYECMRYECGAVYSGLLWFTYVSTDASTLRARLVERHK